MTIHWDIIKIFPIYLLRVKSNQNSKGMKKTKRKILFLAAMIICLIIIAISYKNNSSLSSDIISLEALAASEDEKYECSSGNGFCIIEGIIFLGVTYKE